MPPDASAGCGAREGGEGKAPGGGRGRRAGCDYSSQGAPRPPLVPMATATRLAAERPVMAAGETLGGPGGDRARRGGPGGGEEGWRKFLERAEGKVGCPAWGCPVARGCFPALERESRAGRCQDGWQGMGLSVGAWGWVLRC